MITIIFAREALKAPYYFHGSLSKKVVLILMPHVRVVKGR